MGYVVGSKSSLIENGGYLILDKLTGQHTDWQLEGALGGRVGLFYWNADKNLFSDQFVI